MMRILTYIASLAPLVRALGQQQIISFDNEDSFRLAGGNGGTGQILVTSDDYWGVIRAAGDLTVNFGRVTETNHTLSDGQAGAEPAAFEFEAVDVSNNTLYSTNATASLHGPEYSDPEAASGVIIARTIGNSAVFDSLIEAGKLDISAIDGEWEAFMSKVVQDPISGCSEALVIAGGMPRGTIFGIYDISEQIGVYMLRDSKRRKALRYKPDCNDYSRHVRVIDLKMWYV